MTRRHPLGKILVLLLLLPVSALCADSSEAFAALQRGHVDEAEQSLRADLAANPHDAHAHQLLCRVFYSQDRGAEAAQECEAAVANAPHSQKDSLSLEWLGRAYGLKASQVNPITAFSLARRVRSTFERALQADPNNDSAMSDLGQFCVSAPSIAGGDLARARQLAAALLPQAPAKAHRLLAYLADNARDSATAENEFKAAVAAAHTPETYIDLALFYQTHHQADQAPAAAQQAIRADHLHGPALVDAASILLDAKRAPTLAEQALRDYLASPNQTEDSPVFKVHVKLGKLLQARGDRTGARQEFASALKLAANYGPARDAMKGA